MKLFFMWIKHDTAAQMGGGGGIKHMMSQDVVSYVGKCIFGSPEYIRDINCQHNWAAIEWLINPKIRFRDIWHDAN